MKIAVIGCGWVGKKLAEYLTGRGHHVIATTTSPDKIQELKTVAAEVHLLDFSKDSESEFLNDTDAAIFSMPISRSSWFKGFEEMQNLFPKTILFSSTGIYPQENRIFSEKDTTNLRTDIAAAEKTVREKYPQTNILRFGGLMGGERTLQNFFRNREVSNPEKRVNYIHYEDILAIVELLINSDKASAIYNVVAPKHPAIGEILNREDGKSADSYDSGQRIISSELLIKEFNYTFLHPDPKFFSA
ncbi:NAD(P)-binding domain-containing protein [Kaistella faecalis]|uniref:NAD(P)-binding domain-containing protein n=1 Tax=Kaistella faecalis TaxID=2852098 RepID=UPI001C444892|nr:NAD(P)H-binding protein [Chryseobacterium faecale]UFK97068.1 NAD(P)-binding domain-containing protein [Chryseobacterium faecale]